MVVVLSTPPLRLVRLAAVIRAYLRVGNGVADIGNLGGVTVVVVISVVVVGVIASDIGKGGVGVVTVVVRTVISATVVSVLGTIVVVVGVYIVVTGGGLSLVVERLLGVGLLLESFLRVVGIVEHKCR